MGSLSQSTRGWLESGGIAAPNIISTSTPNPNTVILEWSQPVTLTPFGTLPTSYTVIPPPLHGAVTVTSAIMTDGTHLQLTTTDQENGASYQLNISQGVVQKGGSVVNFATSVFFTGNNVPLSVLSSRLVDATDLIITYSRAVQQVSASTPGNYVFVPTLTVTLVERIADNQYNIKTSRMQPNTFYTLTISDVRALDGSVI